MEVAVGAFFNGKEFIYPINVNFEHKKLFPGNIGPSTGEMGTAMFWSGPNRLFNADAEEDGSRSSPQEGYVGYIDLNCIVNGNGIYPLEFTARFGYPTISIQQEGMITPIGQFLYDLATGVDPEAQGQERLPDRRAHRRAALSVRRRRHVLLCLQERGDPVQEGHPRGSAHRGRQAGERPVVRGRHLGRRAVVCGLGQTMRQAQAQAYSRIRNIMIPDMYYRDDIGERWFEDTTAAHLGYLR